MMVDFSAQPYSPETAAAIGRRCYVDGVEVRLVWYADTKAGMVRSYDVLGDTLAHAFAERDEWPAGTECVRGIASITRLGTVEIR